MQALHAIYELGIFRPTEPVNLPELCEVEIVVKSLSNVVNPEITTQIKCATEIMHRRSFVLSELAK